VPHAQPGEMGKCQQGQTRQLWCTLSERLAMAPITVPASGCSASWEKEPANASAGRRPASSKRHLQGQQHEGHGWQAATMPPSRGLESPIAPRGPEPLEPERPSSESH